MNEMFFFFFEGLSPRAEASERFVLRTGMRRLREISLPPPPLISDFFVSCNLDDTVPRHVAAATWRPIEILLPEKKNRPADDTGRPIYDRIDGLTSEFISG